MTSERGLFPAAARKIETLDKAEVNQLGRLLLLSFTGFLVAGWFLSRALCDDFLSVGWHGRGGLRDGSAAGDGGSAHDGWARTLPYAGLLTIGMILLMYIMVRREPDAVIATVHRSPPANSGAETSLR